MIAWKFMRPGAVSPLTRFAWPAPGVWVEAPAAIGCRAGFHACRVEHLAHWIAEELWEIELAGALDALDAVVAPRARLIRRVEAWDGDGGARFLARCAHAAVEAMEAADAETRERMRPFAETAQRCVDRGNKAVGAYAAASAIAMAALSLEDRARLFREERACQSQWLADLL